MKSISRVVSVALMVMLFAGMPVLTGCSKLAPSEPAAEELTPVVDDSLLVTPGTLTVGIDSTNAPYAGENNGEVIGIDADVAAALADQMGLKVAYYDISTEGGTNALESGKCDIFLSFDRTTSSKTSNEYIATYLYDAPSLFALITDGTVAEVSFPADMTAKKIAVQSNSVSEVTLTQLYGTDVISEQNSLANVFGTLENGEVDYAAASGIAGKYLIHSTPYVDIAWVGALSSTPTEIGIGGKSSSADLNAAVRTALDTIGSNGVLDLVLNRWIGEPLTPGDFGIATDATDQTADTTGGTATQTDATAQTGAAAQTDTAATGQGAA